jgi:hypothetical protein
MYFDLAAMWKSLHSSPRGSGITVAPVTTTCYNSVTGAICGNPQNYLYFDSLHPVSSVHKLFVLLPLSFFLNEADLPPSCSQHGAEDERPRQLLLDSHTRSFLRRFSRASFFVFVGIWFCLSFSIPPPSPSYPIHSFLFLLFIRIWHTLLPPFFLALFVFISSSRLSASAITPSLVRHRSAQSLLTTTLASIAREPRRAGPTAFPFLRELSTDPLPSTSPPPSANTRVLRDATERVKAC